MHFSFDCTNNAGPRAIFTTETEEEDELAEQLYRMKSGNFTSYKFQQASTHAGAIYHEDDEEEDLESENVFGGR
jgi:hypothetical protein